MIKRNIRFFLLQLFIVKSFCATEVLWVTQNTLRTVTRPLKYDYVTLLNPVSTSLHVATMTNAGKTTTVTTLFTATATPTVIDSGSYVITINSVVTAPDPLITGSLPTLIPSTLINLSTITEGTTIVTTTTATFTKTKGDIDPQFTGTTSGINSLYTSSFSPQPSSSGFSSLGIRTITSSSSFITSVYPTASTFFAEDLTELDPSSFITTVFPTTSTFFVEDLTESGACSEFSSYNLITSVISTSAQYSNSTSYTFSSNTTTKQHEFSESASSSSLFPIYSSSGSKNITSTPVRSSSFSIPSITSITSSSLSDASFTKTESTASATNTSLSSRSSLSTIPSITLSSLSSTSITRTESTAITSDTPSTFSIFDPISTDAPPAVFQRSELILERPSHISSAKVVETNKFYANLFLGSFTNMVWTHPYGFWWDKSSFYGLGVSHTRVSQRTYGDTNSNGAVQNYINPVNVASLIFSSTTFTDSNVNMVLENLETFSVDVKLGLNNQDYIKFPLVQGISFASGIYNGNLIPLLRSSIGFKSVSAVSSTNVNSKTTNIFKALLFDGTTWLIYAVTPNGENFNFNVKDSNNMVGSQSIDGLLIQVTVLSSDDNQTYYDQVSGAYATSASLSGTSNSLTSSWSIDYEISGKNYLNSNEIIIFAFPHHLENISGGKNTGIKLSSTTKGDMTGILASSLSFFETLPVDVGFLPWSQQLKSSTTLSFSSEELQKIAIAANKELTIDIESAVSTDSTYTSGKLIDKFAYILLTLSDIIRDDAVTNATLATMKVAFELFLKNQQITPLMYDTRWGGVTSTGAQATGDSGADFGSPFYNDHHFHYGYFIHAAAVVGHVDLKFGGTWANDNKDWVNSLIRDVANPSSSDTYFPVSRNFDWFHGHSWAKGLFDSADGKDQESSSEDYNFAYGMKLWGRIINDKSMETRGNLMLAIMKRSMNLYYLYSDDNTVEPSNYIKNRVPGILFENKFDYTTYFGTNIEYIHGIQMIPVTPISSLIRGPTFVKQEWDSIISSMVDTLDSGWRGILKLNQALYDPETSWSFFTQDNFNSNWLDNGASLTWCLAYVAGLKST